MDVKFIQLLEHRLAQELPGADSQNLMAPEGSEKYRIISPNHKIACVLLLIFPKEKEWYISLIERASQHPEDKHGGQLGFPGGKLDPSDNTYEDCALRETYEELGVPPDSVGILGSLTPLYVYVSNFLVHPYVGFTTEYPKFIQQESEVKSIIEVPVNRFLKSKYKSFADISVRDFVLKNTPYYDIYGQQLWGATAMMISEFEQILKDIWE
ncbi:MAG: CoA pyrophosphatase [Saprospiraceae bacterium]|nr:CoA pyrophosphatase [Saprospiraceae bacterium]